MRTIAFKTFGCKANSLETDALLAEARKRGFLVVPDTVVADAYVINSCTVTHGADRDARNYIGRYKRLNPQALVGVVGCYAQVSKDELLSTRSVDFIVGTANKLHILDLVEHNFGSPLSERDFVEPAHGFLPEKFPGSRHSRAVVKIQDGCNFSCSYCIIPKARGRSRSLPPDVVVRQILDAHEQGFQEVVLTAIHLGHYGWDNGCTLVSLLRRIFAKDDGPRIRLSTLDPFEIDDELIDMVATEKRLCPHFHIALQSGNDQTLKKMRRTYKAQDFNSVTTKIFEHCPDAFVGVDVLVGFPGEGSAQFQDTVQCLKDSFWSKLHVFPFSPRKGTMAETMPDRASSLDVTERRSQLLELSQQRYQHFLKSQTGKQRNVLIEKPSRIGGFFGRAENYAPIYLKGTGKENPRTIVGRVVQRFQEGKLWA
ncbi:MAG: tRNA (N(6)-L-threonylcarbamoyladenosine(37)-C(2))-methylthiotransferase MtaB [Deltaproteobacteria bacterium]|nr:tRNA (N(6)-L-threonylcarbamoyladenosine(37)-C(2))-methylthiotransferase MtaB [Deltaproteobacteria bacterium]